VPFALENRTFRRVALMNRDKLDIVKCSPAGVHNILCDVIEKAVADYNKKVIVAGEVGGLIDNRKDTGWMFFYLKDSDRSIRCVAPPSVCENIEFNIKEGSRIVTRGRLWLYRKDASVELLLESIELQKSLAERIREDSVITKLDSEGLLTKARLKAVPKDPPPSDIAIIAPHNSQAPVDIRTTATGSGGLTFHVRFLENHTPEAIVTEIERCNRHKGELDAIIITNCGGDDLHIYDNEELLRAVIASDLPVISAIGETADKTLLDYIAAESLSTPALAGKWLRELHRDFKQGRRIERKQVLAFSFIGLLIIVVLVVLWGIGILGK